jgi:hypothetical protein
LVKDHLAAGDGLVDALEALDVTLNHFYIAFKPTEVAASSGREVVEQAYPVASLEQALDEMRADETCPARD